MKIVVLAGGLSTERQVSLTSGTGVCRALRERGHQAILVDMFLGLEDYNGSLSDIFDAPGGLCGDNRVHSTEPDLEAVRRSRRDQGPSMLGKDVLTVCAMADLVFLALHGACGEDGRIQATLDLLGVPYTGAGYLGSAIAMDKIASKQMMDANGIPNPKWQALTYTEEEIPHLAETLPMPCVVKAPTGGSSLGVYLPKDRAELADALHQVRAYTDRVLVEQRVYGRELTNAVLGDRYLPAVETFPSVENFDYEAKYQAGGAKEVCPAELTEEQARAVGEMALRVHKALGLAVYSRTDMIMDENGQLWCLEANSLPGMTPTSFVPKEAAAVGISLCQAGNVFGPIAFLLVYNIPAFLIRIFGAIKGYELGIGFLDEAQKTGLMQKIMACVGIVGVMVVGAMSKDMFWASLPIAIGQGDSAQTLQDILDGIMPGMLGMAAFWLYYWLLSKKINPMVLILCTMVVGIIGAYFGVLA